MKSDPIDVTVWVHAKTDRAVLVSDDGVPANSVWLPLSQCEVAMVGPNTAEVTMPEWLATDKGLV